MIEGLNPSKDQVKNGLSTEEQVIVYMESRPKWKHFRGDPGFPIWGTPHGYGLMQIDPPDNNEQVWSWKANRTEGQRRFAEKKTFAAAYPAKMKSRGGRYRYVSDYTQEEYLTDSFQLYNGYHYWVWKFYAPKIAPFLGGYWEKDPNLGKPKSAGGYGRDYGGPAIRIYNQVENGNPPSGW